MKIIYQPENAAEFLQACGRVLAEDTTGPRIVGTLIIDPPGLRFVGNADVSKVTLPALLTALSDQIGVTIEIAHPERIRTA